MTRVPTPKTDSIRPWHAWLGFAVGGVVAMVASVIVAVIAAIAVGLGGQRAFDEALFQDIWVLLPSMLGSHGTLIGVAFFVPFVAGARPTEALGLRRAPALALVLAPVGILALGPTSDQLVRFMRAFLPDLTFGTLESLDEVMRQYPLWALWPFVALLPGFAEELFFRGMFQRGLGKGGLAIAASGVCFAAFHLDPHHVVGVLPLGFYLAWLGARTQSIWVPIVAHVVNNSVALLGSHYADPADPEELPAWVMLVGWAILAGVVTGIVWSTRERADTPLGAPAQTALAPEPARVRDDGAR